jgi:hypothetical protein
MMDSEEAVPAPLPSTEDSRRLWESLIAAHNKYISIRMKLFASGADIVTLVKSGLLKPSERHEALTIAGLLNEPRKREAFAELVWTASWDNGSVQMARQVIDTIDRDWVLEHLPAVVQPVLDRADGAHPHSDRQEYGHMIDLLARYGSPYLDEVLARALAHPDADVREYAEDFRNRS